MQKRCIDVPENWNREECVVIFPDRKSEGGEGRGRGRANMRTGKGEVKYFSFLVLEQHNIPINIEYGALTREKESKREFGFQFSLTVVL